MYLERYLPDPRHIEFQILADSQGNVVHLGERECSIQRRHQKLIEESPSPALDAGCAKRMGEVAVSAARWVGYEGAGTVEFLWSGGEFYFMEVNARVQVEHPVTEMVTGIDIVKEQIRVASGLPLSLSQDEVTMNGWAIECRINAEDRHQRLRSFSGQDQGLPPPGGTGVRVDSGVYDSYTIPPFYDSLIAKLIVWGRDRNEAISRMTRALHEYAILGSQDQHPLPPGGHGQRTLRARGAGNPFHRTRDRPGRRDKADRRADAEPWGEAVSSHSRQEEDSRDRGRGSSDPELRVSQATNGGPHG